LKIGHEVTRDVEIRDATVDIGSKAREAPTLGLAPSVTALAVVRSGGIPSASSIHVQRSLLALSGILVLGTTGAFFLYVSILSIMAVGVILMALMLMFILGVQAASQADSTPAIVQARPLRRYPPGLLRLWFWFKLR
jgi:hypothetical protein